MEGFLVELLRVSERAATIARLCRVERALFELLVEEKTGEAKNKRFKRDFKTLGDVLIQETIRHYLGQQFPSLRDHILGEESSEFTNTLGESIVVRVCQSEEETSDLLTRVLDGNTTAARLLAGAVHGGVTTPTLSGEHRGTLRGMAVDLTQVGVWIDPIDGTNEYIHGGGGSPLPSGVHTAGLQCVTVLLGVFNLRTGEPVFGVVNQPFWRWQEERRTWTGRQVWGVCHGGVSVISVPSCLHRGSGTRVVMSSSEFPVTVDALKEAGWEVIFAAGAGYKLLCVIDGLVGVYPVTKSSTFKWDTCGPQAILRSLGGDIVQWHGALEAGTVVPEHGLRYHRPDDPSLSEGQRWSNSRGILAYRAPEVAQTVIDVFRKEREKLPET